MKKEVLTLLPAQVLGKYTVDKALTLNRVAGLRLYKTPHGASHGVSIIRRADGVDRRGRVEIVQDLLLVYPVREVLVE